MYKTLGSLAVLLFAVALTVGCGDGKTKTTGGKTPPVTVVSHDDFEVCKKCGEIEKSANCCNDKDESGKIIDICKDCGDHKGSPGCCIDEHIHVCKKCGEIEKSANCCKVKDESGKTIEICDKCKRHKGSFGCCVVLKSEVGKTKTKATP